jgi:hypothetical protein
MAVRAQRLQLAKPKLVDVTMVRFNVIGNTSRNRTSTFAQTHRAERFNTQLVLRHPSPALSTMQAHQNTS